MAWWIGCWTRPGVGRRWRRWPASICRAGIEDTHTLLEVTELFARGMVKALMWSERRWPFLDRVTALHAARRHRISCPCGGAARVVEPGSSEVEGWRDVPLRKAAGRALSVSSDRGECWSEKCSDVEGLLGLDLLAALGSRGLSWRSTALVPVTTASVIAPNWWFGCRSGWISSIPTLSSV